MVPEVQVESIVLKRYGRDAYRMFRLLSKAGQLLETDKVLVKYSFDSIACEWQLETWNHFSDNEC